MHICMSIRCAHNPVNYYDAIYSMRMYVYMYVYIYMSIGCVHNPANDYDKHGEKKKDK